MYGDWFGEFVCGYWDLEGYSDGPKVSVLETVDSSLLTQAYGYAGS